MLAEQNRELPTPGRKRKEAFIDRLAEFDWRTQETVIAAYDLAEVAHDGQFRGITQGVNESERIPYFTHVLATANILIDECGIKDPDIIIGALLHDTVEDTPMFGDIYKLSSSRWLEIAQFRLGELFFNPKVAEIVISLTKPKIDDVEIFTEEERRKTVIDKLQTASPEAILVKMADRLHNLRTLGGLDEWKAQMVIAETQGEEYKQIFAKAEAAYPDQVSYLRTQMGDAICDYEWSNNR